MANNEKLNLLYKEVSQLMLINDDQEPGNEPYKSKYAALEKLEQLKSLLTIELDGRGVSNQESHLWNSKLAVVYLLMGNIGLHTEELSTGQEKFEKALDIIKDSELSPLFITVAVSSYNNLAILWSHRSEHEKSLNYLSSAKELFEKYRKLENVEPPKSEQELFSDETLQSSPVGWEAFEKIHTLTLFYLAQVMGKLGRSHESAFYCLSTLQRQLAMNDFQPLSWALNAATLAKFFEDTQKYRLARRLLAAASAMLEFPPLFGCPMKLTEESEEKIKETRAEVSRRWGCYCVCLLQDSYERCEEENVETGNRQEREPPDQSHSEKISLEQMEFCQLELSTMEGQVGCETVKDYESAKSVFMSGLRWLNEAQKYYALDDFASTHTEIAQNVSSLYKYLASFDSCPERRSKMHKRRVDVLKMVSDELNPKYYLQVCRQLDYELGETYSAMIDCKYASLGQTAPNPHQGAKINHLVKSSIQHFEKFLATFRTDSGEIPEKYPEENERPVLVAFFHLGRLWSKILSADRQEKIRVTSKSLENYKFLVDYCDRDPRCAELMSLELPASREIAQLLPYKIQRMRN